MSRRDWISTWVGTSVVALPVRLFAQREIAPLAAEPIAATLSGGACDPACELGVLGVTVEEDTRQRQGLTSLT